MQECAPHDVVAVYVQSPLFQQTRQCSNSSPTRIPTSKDLEDFVSVYGCLRISSTLHNIVDFNINGQSNVILDPAFNVVPIKMCHVPTV